MFTVSKASQATASTLTATPARPSRTGARRHPRPAHARDERRQGDEQEGHVDRGGPERDEAADRRRVQPEQQPEARDDRGHRRRPDGRARAGRRGAAAARRAGRRRARSRTSCARSAPARPSRRRGRRRARRRRTASSTTSRRTRRPRSRPGRRRARHDRGGSGWASVDRDGVEDHEHADAEQGDPDRPRDVTRRVARLLRRGDARVEADEDPAADGQRGEQSGADGAAGQRLGAQRVAEQRQVLLAEGEQEREPDADRGDDLGGDARRDRATRGRPMPKRAGQRADDDEPMPVDDDRRWPSARCPRSVSAQGAPR